MLTAVLTPKCVSDLKLQIQSVQGMAQSYELRIDCLDKISLFELTEVRSSIDLPLILTCRPKDQGGFFQGSESERLSLLRQVAELNPDFIDFEHTVDASDIEKFHQQFPHISLIRSYHNFDETPQDLAQIFSELEHPSCKLYKISCFANSSLDAMRMLVFLRKHHKGRRLNVHCMGELGQFSRICGSFLGNMFTYASLSDESTVASGILSLSCLRDIYHIQDKNCDTQIYALLGNPVSQSLGHQFHNAIFHEREKNAIYVKCQLQKEELNDFFQLAAQLPFAGYSVTMPLKIAVLPFIHMDDAQIGACNTIRVTPTGLSGCNTDGIGAINALAQDIQGCSMLIIGGGGAASAIAHEGVKQGCKLTLINRSLEKAAKIADSTGATLYDLETLPAAPPQPYRFVINTLPGQTELPAAICDYLSRVLTSDTQVMDICYSHPNTQLLALAALHRCRTIPGKNMFTEQALAQQKVFAGV